MPEAEIHHLPTPFNERPASQALDRLQFYQTFVRKWAGGLTASEFTVMAQIVDRTVGWGLTTIEITTTRLLKGDNLYKGMGVSRAQMFRVLTELETKGCIVRKTTATRIVITINTQWEPEMIAIPKRLRGETKSAAHLDDFAFAGLQPGALDDENRSHHETTLSHHETAPVSLCDTLNTIPLTQSSEANADLAGQRVVRGEDAVLLGRMKNLDAVTGKLAKTNVTAESVWRAALAEHFPQVPHAHWTMKDKGRVKQHRSKWTIIEGLDLGAFLKWTVANWAQIIAAEFAWMTENPPPAVPSVSFLLSQWGRFLDVLAERKLEAWLTDADRTELERKMARGLTRDEALRELGATDAATQLRREMRIRESKVGDRVKQARMAEERAENLARFGDGAPIHPRSRIAQEARAAARAPQPGASAPSVPVGPLAAPKVKFDD